MRIAALGSGSKGNAVLLQSASTTLMIDCGFGLRETEKRLADIGLVPSDISAILVTHEHQDHISGVEPFAFRFSLPVYMTEGTYRAWKHKGRVEPSRLRAGESLTIGGLKIVPVAVPHDAREPVQFVFSCGDLKAGVLTDLGSLTPHLVEAYEGCHALLVEANHDQEMLRNGPYPPSLKRRVGGNWGHLNNGQTAEFISRVNTSGILKNLIVGHISEQNNQIELAEKALESQLDLIEQVLFASQDQPMDWIELVPINRP